MVQNPVRAGWMADATTWPFSSYPEYMGLRQGMLSQPEIVLSQFASSQTLGVSKTPGV
ncbi:MAG: hypothetical protein HYR94_14190 [Chloroflexi bacterium]|nr:hypothetical protein [Chloroflexota bacterium]